MIPNDEYKGYRAFVEFDYDTELLYGRVLDIAPDMVTFDSISAKEIFAEFRRAVDEYLDQCTLQGRAPISPVQAEAHRQAVFDCGLPA